MLKFYDTDICSDNPPDENMLSDNEPPKDKVKDRKKLYKD